MLPIKLSEYPTVDPWGRLCTPVQGVKQNNDGHQFLTVQLTPAAGYGEGGMFDCDGDRREYAKKQYQQYLDKNKQ